MTHSILATFGSEALLGELVRRGAIHQSRLRDQHEVTFTERGFRMSHPLSCDVTGDCEHHAELDRWWDEGHTGGHEVRIGQTYRFDLGSGMFEQRTVPI